MFPNKYTNVFLSVALLTVVVTVIWYSIDNYSGFVDNHRRLAQRAVVSAGREIEMFMSERKRFVRLFADREQALLLKVIEAPETSPSHRKLEEKIDIYFPHHFAFTIADDDGLPLLTRGRDLVGGRCRKDIQQFSTNTRHPHIYIHPSPETQKQHFDIMSPITEGGRAKVFFVSFFLDDVFRLLDHGKIDGHHLFLVRRDTPRILEAATPGAREEYTKAGHRFAQTPSVKRGEYRWLWPQSLQRNVLAAYPVADTRWDLVDVPEPDLFMVHRLRLITQAAAVMALFGIVAAAGFALTRRLGTLSGDTYAVLTSVENERQRIARDLHDQVLSDISHIRRGCRTLCAADPLTQDVGSQASGIQAALEQVTNTIRDVIDDLHPHSLGLLGLAETIRSYCNKQPQQLSGLIINLDIGRWNERRLSSTEQLNLFRIVQEALHNTIRHAGASHCHIGLDMSPTRLSIRIEDDGTGLDKARVASSPGRGIKNIQARGRIIGAKTAWVLRPDGNGTRFNLDMPLCGADE